MLILLTGGAANGKSRFAERLAAQYEGPRTYVATMRPDGDDGLERVRRHRKQREGLGFVTIEKETNLEEVEIKERGLVLLECVATLLDNEWFQRGQTKEEAIDAVFTGVDHLLAASDLLIVVTNTISDEGKSYDQATLSYIDAINRINRHLMELADAAIEMRVGIPIRLKGKLALEKAFPTFSIGTARIVDPVEIIEKEKGLVLALAAQEASLHRLALAAGFKREDIADGAWLDRPILSGLDKLLQVAGNRVFSYDFATYQLVMSRLWGDGVIPIQEKERRLREMAGRLTIHIAAKARAVMYFHDNVWLYIQN